MQTTTEAGFRSDIQNLQSELRSLKRELDRKIQQDEARRSNAQITFWTFLMVMSSFVCLALVLKK